MYRISYSVGGSNQRRVTRSVAIYGGQSERRVWSGEIMPCLDFALPQGRTLSLLTNQLVDARPAELNERGQWVLQQPEGHHRRAPRRHRGGLGLSLASGRRIRSSDTALRSAVAAGPHRGAKAVD